MASRNILTVVPLQGLTIAGIGVGAGVVFGIVFARGIGRCVAEEHVPRIDPWERYQDESMNYGADR